MSKTSRRNKPRSKIQIFIAYFICLLGLIIFAKGFFPIKASRRGASSIKDVPPAPFDQDTIIKLIKEDLTQKTAANIGDKSDVILAAPFKKLVLLVIDAMRIDFIQDPSHAKDMPFLHSVLKQNHGKVYTAKAKAPTVTMPRLKAMMTGSIPGYIDVILNMDQSQELKDDNLIQGLVNNGKKIIFYGDDTWMRLFPKAFFRADGTNSFFVTDYTEVDNNVTRHLDDELRIKTDWNVMILHYLGLDHIGHIAGPNSPLVAPKLREMDSSIKSIYESLKKQKDSLVVITSDHGMSARGSHGGTTDPEVDTPLLFLSPDMIKNKDEPQKVDQIDLAPTLALLTGVPIPLSSMGKVIPGMLKVQNDSTRLHSMQYNCHQLLKHLAHSGRLNNYFSNPKTDPLHLYRNGVQFHGKYLGTGEPASHSAALDNYGKCQVAASDTLTSNLASYNYPEMTVGIAILYMGFCLVLYQWVDELLRNRARVPGGQRSKSFTRAVIALLAGTLLHVATLASSSFVEEEHQIWYFLTASLCLVLMVAVARAAAEAEAFKAEKTKPASMLYDAQANHSAELRLRRGGRAWQVVSSDASKPEQICNGEVDPKDVAEEEEEDRSHFKDHPLASRKHSKVLVVGLVLLACHRILRSWNQTGIQYADQQDIGDWLNLPDHKLLLSLTSSFSLVLVFLSTEILCSTKDLLRSVLCAVGLTTVYFYRCATDVVAFFVRLGSHNQSIGLTEARLVYVICAFLITKSIFHRLSSIFCDPSTPSKTRRCPPTPLYCSPTPTSRKQALDCLQSAAILLSALLLRPHNHTILALNLVLYWCLFRLMWPVAVEGKRHLMDCDLITRDLTLCGGVTSSQAAVRIAVTCWFGQMSYFTLGNSNSFATVDLSAGYVGLSGSEGLSNSIFTVMLGSYATYIGPILWITLCVFDLIKLCVQDEEDTGLRSSSPGSLVSSTMIVIRLLQLTMYVAVATGHRYHLFVWSVFSPKLLYEIVNSWIHAGLLGLTLLLW